jgi:hypothetical protein
MKQSPRVVDDPLVNQEILRYLKQKVYYLHHNDLDTI